MKKNKGAQITAHIVLGFMSLLVVLPFLLMISSSLTEEEVLIQNGYSLFPRQVSFEAYQYLFSGAGNIFNAYGVTLLVTAAGTICSLFLTCTLAYATSLKDLPGRKTLSFLIYFTMLFNGGLVPTYMLYTNTLHLKNTLWALIIPGLLMNAFQVIIARSYFETSIPPEILEAARIDGASEVCVIRKVVLPISLPILATLGLMIGLAYWNNWTNGLYYITDEKLYSIQHLLSQMMRNMQKLQEGNLSSGMQGELMKNIPSTSLRMAIAVLGALPVLVIYPIFQKYFVKGMTIGAVKG